MNPMGIRWVVGFLSAVIACGSTGKQADREDVGTSRSVAAESSSSSQTVNGPIGGLVGRAMLADRSARSLGLPGLFIDAARRAGVTEDTDAALGQVQRRLENVTGAESRARKVFGGDLALCLRTGKMDDARIQIDVTNAERARANTQAEQHRAFRTLHDLLNVSQRRAVAETIRSTLGRTTTQGQARQSREAESERGTPSRMLDGLTSALQLDARQVQTLARDVEMLDKPASPDAALVREDAANRQLANLLVAFEDESFAAIPIDLTPVGPPTAEMLRRQVKLVKLLLPVLMPEQAEKYALTLLAG
jgi:hypothetical protein